MTIKMTINAEQRIQMNASQKLRTLVKTIIREIKFSLEQRGGEVHPNFFTLKSIWAHKRGPTNETIPFIIYYSSHSVNINSLRGEILSWTK